MVARELSTDEVLEHVSNCRRSNRGEHDPPQIPVSEDGLQWSQISEDGSENEDTSENGWQDEDVTEDESQDEIC
jgi:hypothetical protein